MRIDKTQQNSKCRLCGNRDETFNHMISECSKLALKEYKTRHNRVGKLIHWELSKKFKFDHTKKWHIHKPASVLENDKHKLFWDFDIQTDSLILVRRPDLTMMNKKRELEKWWTLLSRLTTKYNWKNSKRRISTSTLLGNWKRNCGEWRWQLYQSWLVLLLQ